jgi:hypothetical protein
LGKKQDEILKFQVLRHSGKVKMQLSPCPIVKARKINEKRAWTKNPSSFFVRVLHIYAFLADADCG